MRVPRANRSGGARGVAEEWERARRERGPHLQIGAELRRGRRESPELHHLAVARLARRLIFPARSSLASISRRSHRLVRPVVPRASRHLFRGRGGGGGGGPRLLRGDATVRLA